MDPRFLESDAGRRNICQRSTNLERVDDIIDVSRDEAEAMTRDLAVEEGLFVGLSSGGACRAALRVAETAKPGSEIVFIVCDRGDKYLSIESLFPS